MKIHADHLVERRTRSALHLPQPSQARPDFQNSAPMPAPVPFEFVGKRWAGTYERHVTGQYIHELRQLVQAGLAEEPAQGSNPRIVKQLVHPVRLLGMFRTLDQLLHIVAVYARVVVHVHRAKLVEIEGLSELYNA